MTVLAWNGEECRQLHFQFHGLPSAGHVWIDVDHAVLEGCRYDQAASFVQTDDLESFVRAQKGLQSHLTDWVDISRGLGAEEPDSATNATRGLATHEMVVRAQYKAWLGYMDEAA